MPPTMRATSAASDRVGDQSEARIAVGDGDKAERGAEGEDSRDHGDNAGKGEDNGGHTVAGAKELGEQTRGQCAEQRAAGEIDAKIEEHRAQRVADDAAEHAGPGEAGRHGKQNGEARGGEGGEQRVLRHADHPRGAGDGNVHAGNQRGGEKACCDRDDDGGGEAEAADAEGCVAADKVPHAVDQGHAGHEDHAGHDDTERTGGGEAEGGAEAANGAAEQGGGEGDQYRAERAGSQFQAEPGCAAPAIAVMMNAPQSPTKRRLRLAAVSAMPAMTSQWG